MRRLLCLTATVLLCLALVSPALAAEAEFAPSIPYKDAPPLVAAALDEEQEPVDPCLTITSITAAEEKLTDITQSARDQLLEIYEELTEGTMELPLEGSYIIRELLDVSFCQNGCVEETHMHKETLDVHGITITITFDLGVEPTDKVTVLSYANNEWTPALSVINNGDGTITCEFEHLCPVVFCVEQAEVVTIPTQAPVEPTPQEAPFPWWILLLLALAALVLVVDKYRKSKAAQ